MNLLEAIVMAILFILAAHWVAHWLGEHIAYGDYPCSTDEFIADKGYSPEAMKTVRVGGTFPVRWYWTAAEMFLPASCDRSELERRTRSLRITHLISHVAGRYVIVRFHREE
jgi:hypothetical protein